MRRAQNHVGQRFLVAASLPYTASPVEDSPWRARTASPARTNWSFLLQRFLMNRSARRFVQKSCACCANSCVQVSRSPDPHRGRASATNSRGLAKATSRMDRARRRVSHVRFLRGAPEAAPRNLCPVGTGRNSFAARARSLLPSSLMPARSKTRRGELGPFYACHGVALRRRVAHSHSLHSANWASTAWGLRSF